MKLETLATHYGYDQKSGTGAMAVPIYQATAFDFGDAQTAADRFALRQLGPIYSRLTNPTVEIFENRIAAMEGGSAAIATSSGQAAVFATVANLAEAGDEVLLAKQVYGGTNTLITYTLKRLGINSKIFDAEDVSNLENLITDKTKVILFETLSNPQISVADIDSITKIANKRGIVSVADNTVATPILFRPFEHGADVVVHSASKYISGQGLSMAGVTIASKSLNKKLVKNPRYAHFNAPDESYHGLVYADLVENFDIFTLRIRLGLLRDVGFCLSPFNAFQLIQGLETLAIRVKKHSENSIKIAEFLEKHSKVKSVSYPALKSSKFNDFVSKNFDGGLSSGLLSFEVESFEVAKKVLNSTKIFAIVVNIGDSKSIITHPASTTHSQLSKAELDDAGIPEGLIRLSVGLEDADDLIADLENALK